MMIRLLVVLLLLPMVSQAAWLQYRLDTGAISGFPSDGTPPGPVAGYGILTWPDSAAVVRASFPLPPGCTAAQVEREMYRVASATPPVIQIFPNLLDTARDGITLFRCQIVTSVRQLEALGMDAIAQIDTAYAGARVPNIQAGISSVCPEVGGGASCVASRGKFKTLLKRARRAEGATAPEDEAALAAAIDSALAITDEVIALRNQTF